MTARASVLDERYGRTPDRRRRRLVVAIASAAVLVAAVVAWAVWTGVGGSSTALDVETTSVAVQSDQATTVSWTVTGRAATTLVCAIEARDPSGVVVGLVEERLEPAGRPDRAGTTVVRTVRRASTGLIVSCRDA